MLPTQKPEQASFIRLISKFDDLLTTAEVGKILQVHANTVINWTKSGELAAFKTPGGQRRIRADAVLAFVRSRGMVVPPELHTISELPPGLPGASDTSGGSQSAASLPLSYYRAKLLVLAKEDDLGSSVAELLRIGEHLCGLLEKPLASKPS